MDINDDRARPGYLVIIALMGIGAAGVLGGLTNVVNGAVSPLYFRNILRWHHIDNIWRAAVAQGLFEGLIYGVIFSAVFTLVVGQVTKLRATPRFAVRHLLLAGGVVLGAWCIGGLAAVGLAMLSPDFYRNTFIGVPSEPAEMAKYAWVGGSIWGALAGGMLAAIIAPVAATADWRRRHAAQPAPS